MGENRIQKGKVATLHNRNSSNEGKSYTNNKKHFTWGALLEGTAGKEIY